MSRSVSIPNGTVLLEYIDVSDFSPDGSDWDFFVDDIRYRLKDDFKSLSDCNKWLGREDNAILENDHCYIGLSEYNSLVSLWCVPKETNLALNWIEQIRPKFKKYGDLKKIATFSNGEAIFERKENATETISSNGSRW